MSSATRSLNGFSLSYSSSGGIGSSGSDSPTSHGAASTAVRQAASSGSLSAPAPASSGAGSTMSRYTFVYCPRCCSWYSIRTRLPSSCCARSPIDSLKVVYSLPSPSLTTKRIVPLLVLTASTVAIFTTASMDRWYPRRRPRKPRVVRWRIRGYSVCVALKAATIRLSPTLWSMLEEEAARQEISVSQFVRDAALLRVGYLAGARGDEEGLRT